MGYYPTQGHVRASEPGFAQAAGRSPELVPSALALEITDAQGHFSMPGEGKNSTTSARMETLGMEYRMK